jgi:hypothetical protein
MAIHLVRVNSGCTLSCILAVECARPPLRVPAVYLAQAIVAILAADALRGINNLPVCTSHRGSTPTPGTILSGLFSFS